MYSHYVLGSAKNRRKSSDRMIEVMEQRNKNEDRRCAIEEKRVKLEEDRIQLEQDRRKTDEEKSNQMLALLKEQQVTMAEMLKFVSKNNKQQ